MKTNVSKLTVHEKINYRSWFYSNNEDKFFFLAERTRRSYLYSTNNCATEKVPYHPQVIGIHSYELCRIIKTQLFK